MSARVLLCPSGMTSSISSAAGSLKLPTVAQSSPFYFALIFDRGHAVLSSARVSACFWTKVAPESSGEDANSADRGQRSSVILLQLIRINEVIEVSLLLGSVGSVRVTPPGCGALKVKLTLSAFAPFPASKCDNALLLSSL